MPNYTILLPPSEGKAAGGDSTTNWGDVADTQPFAQLNPQRRAVMDALQTALAHGTQADLAKLFGVKGENLDAAIGVNQAIASGPLLPAIQRYTGVMFDYLDYAHMDAPLRQTLEEHTLLFSGLWGLLRPGDRIPDYKLKMDASLDGVGRLSSFWKPHLSAALNPLLAGQVVWDMLPNAHRAAWDGKAAMAARYEVKFVERVEKGGKVTWRTVSHWSKALKGALIRHICAHHITRPDDLHSFTHPQGYLYDPGQSGAGEVVFVKG